MSKFSKGDKARVISVDDRDVGKRVKVGDIVIINEDDSCAPFCILPNGEDHVFTQSQLEHYTDAPKEITLNGATYVLKEEPKPEHEWKFGDIAVHEEYGIGIVCSKPSENTSVHFVNKVDLYLVYLEELTFLRRADLSV